jgi:ribosomal protein S11
MKDELEIFGCHGHSTPLGGLTLDRFFPLIFDIFISMLAIKHTVPRVYAQITRPCVQLTQTRWTSTTTPQQTDEKKKQNSAQFDGILGVLGLSKTEAEGEVLNDVIKPNTNKKAGTGFFDVTSFTSTIDSMNQSPHQLHINATFNNTIITLTRPNGAPLVTTSGGSAGFKKAARSGYEAAHQAAIQLLDKMNAKNLQVPNIHIVLKGFGPGRDAAFKALVSGSPWNVKRITDATPIPFGGCRPKKARRL